MSARERLVSGLSAACLVALAVGMLITLPDERSTNAIELICLVIGYAAISRVRFEFGNMYVTPEQLAFVALLMLAPLPLVPLLVIAAALLAQIPDFVRGDWHWERWTGSFSDSWFCIGPVLALAALAPGTPSLDDAGIYALALAAQMACDLTWVGLRDRLLESVPGAGTIPFVEIWRIWIGVATFDAMLTPVAFVVSVAAVSEPIALLATVPFVLMLDTFSRERRARYGKTLELQRAYRGTVMLLSDVVEFDDEYTAEHSRSVVDLVHATADELNVDPGAREELEFAAMLHDVGKIAIPKEILNKPAKLTDEEFAVMKTHTIEGQFMLDQVGGLLARVGEIVRACHERWDGNGYPDGIAGEEIPLASRIVFACDAYNAMTSDRVYRKALARATAVEELRANAGTQFDPRVVAALIRVVELTRPELGLSPADDIRAVLADRPASANVRAAL